MLEELEARGMVHSVTSSQVGAHVSGGARTVYSGVDPTAPSLHVGNLLPLVGLMHFVRYGHRALVLVGGATGSIGDPSGRSSERAALDGAEVARNVERIREQVRALFARAQALLEARGTPWTGSVEVVNNLDWFRDVSLLEFLGSTGRLARVPAMLARESVRSRLDPSTGGGISFTEFAYQLLQAHDFATLHADRGCTLQLGGSDQLGNISAGIDLIRRQRGLHTDPAFGITLPLLTTASGAKWGKSAGNAVWLDPQLLPHWALYQFFLRQPDADAARLLKTLTLLHLPDAEHILREHHADPARRLAQRTLADQLTRLVRGDAALTLAKAASSILFDPSHSPPAHEVRAAFQDTQTLVTISRQQWPHDPTRLALLVGLVKSRAEARRAIQAGGIHLNHQPIQPGQSLSLADLRGHVTDTDGYGYGYALLRLGKAEHRVVLVSP